MIALPPNSRWTQTNDTEKNGSVWASKNLNFDEKGFVSLSPRTMAFHSETDNADFGMPVAIGRAGSGAYQVATDSSANFTVGISTVANDFLEDSGTNEPTMTSDSHGVFFNNLWHTSTDTTVVSKATLAQAATWTDRITSLASGKRHFLATFDNRRTLCVTNGNIVQQYSTAYATDTFCTIPADYEIVGISYNDRKMAIVTRPASSSSPTSSDAYFFVWDGASTEAGQGVSVGSDACIAVTPYKGSWIVLTRAGQLLYWNGGGFELLAAFPYFYTDNQVGTLTASLTEGNSMIVDGDVVYINFSADLNDFGRNAENQIPQCPSGVWCYDPDVGLYHRWSPSASKADALLVTDANVNTSTDVLTTANTIPATGNKMRYTAASTVVGGLMKGRDYYVIKLTATTFQLAETKELAEAGVYINLTSAGSGGQNWFWTYTFTDYGATFLQSGNVSALAVSGETSTIFQDVFMGASIESTALSPVDTICVGVPFLENRGYLTTPWIYADTPTNHFNSMTVRFRHLKEDDAIVVKVKDRELTGLPATSPNNSTTPHAVWVGDNEFYTTTDLSGAVAALALDDDTIGLECELVAGAGAGQMSQITSITEENGTYSVILEDSIVGATSGVKSYFIVDNYKVFDTISATDDENEAGFKNVQLGIQNRKSIKVKIELRGYKTTIEEAPIINAPAQT